MTKMHARIGVSLLAAGTLILAGCGGGGNSDATGIISFSMTDAPVDEADMVVIAMTEFEFKPVDGPSFRVPVTAAGRQLNLLDFTNGKNAMIIDEEEVPAGEYEWLRIFFDMGASYVRLEADGATYPLFMPSGAQTGYKLVSGFTVPVNRAVSYILDFDLRKSLIAPRGLRGPSGEPRTFLLKPAVRIMNAQETGGVFGVVASELLFEAPGNDEVCAEGGGNAVYAFEGFGADPLAAPPLVTDIVDFNTTTGESEYHLMYLLPGNYTLAFTCGSSADDGVAETYPLDGLEFSELIEVTVVSGQVKQCDIPRDEEASGPC
jgi:hypothetical protein